MVKHIEKLRVRWVDTDASGRIHYTAAFRYFEIAEWELFRKFAISFKDPHGNFGFPRVNVQATFHTALYADDEIAVHIFPEKVGNTSVTFVLEVFKEDVLSISGKVSSVLIGKDGRPTAIPEKIRQALTGDSNSTV